MSDLLDPTNQRILRELLADARIPMTELARKVGLSKTPVALRVRQLEDAGLIERRVPPDDRRAMELRLTAQGELRAAEMTPDLEAHEARNFGGLTPEEAATLRTLLRKYLALDAPKED